MQIALHNQPNPYFVTSILETIKNIKQNPPIKISECQKRIYEKSLT